MDEVDRVEAVFGWRTAELAARLRTWKQIDPGVERAKVLRQMPYGEYLRTPEWRARREIELYRAGHRCQACDDTRHLEVHHRTYEHRGRELPGDLIVLCSSCHTAVHLVMDARQDKVRPSSRRVSV